MATINQIRKQLETATTRLQKNNDRIAMYATRIEKNLAKANKQTGKNVTVDNYKTELHDDFNLYYSIESAIDSKAENERKAVREQKNIDSLTEQLQRMEKEQNEREAANKPLENALRAAMDEFRTIWFERMTNWYANHYDRMRELLGRATERNNRAKTVLYHFQRMHRWNEYRKVQAFLEGVILNTREIISDDANRMEKPEYMAKAEKILVESWENGITKLAEKCRTFGVDDKNITVNYPTVTEKGFEVLLHDGTNRVIDARVIWAAEYSEFVSPHTRYIVTERRNK